MKEEVARQRSAHRQIRNSYNKDDEVSVFKRETEEYDEMPGECDAFSSGCVCNRIRESVTSYIPSNIAKKIEWKYSPLFSEYAYFVSLISTLARFRGLVFPRCSHWP